MNAFDRRGFFGHGVWGLEAAGTAGSTLKAEALETSATDAPKNPPAKGVFVNRARLTTNETGYYEYETIHPGRYQIGANAWRPSHVHFLVQHPGYRRLITQLYFDGDPMNAQDRFIKPSRTIALAKVKVQGQTVELGTFDIVRARA